jgi:hypothetical protein
MIEELAKRTCLRRSMQCIICWLMVVADSHRILVGKINRQRRLSVTIGDKAIDAYTFTVTAQRHSLFEKCLRIGKRRPKIPSRNVDGAKGLRLVVAIPSNRKEHLCPRSQAEAAAETDALIPLNF